MTPSSSTGSLFTTPFFLFFADSTTSPSSPFSSPPFFFLLELGVAAVLPFFLLGVLGTAAVWSEEKDPYLQKKANAVSLCCSLANTSGKRERTHSSFNFFLVTRMSSLAELAEARLATEANLL